MAAGRTRRIGPAGRRCGWRHIPKSPACGYAFPDWESLVPHSSPCCSLATRLTPCRCKTVHYSLPSCGAVAHELVSEAHSGEPSGKLPAAAGHDRVAAADQVFDPCRACPCDEPHCISRTSPSAASGSPRRSAASRKLGRRIFRDPPKSAGRTARWRPGWCPGVVPAMRICGAAMGPPRIMSDRSRASRSGDRLSRCGCRGRAAGGAHTVVRSDGQAASRLAWSWRAMSGCRLLPRCGEPRIRVFRVPRF